MIISLEKNITTKFEDILPSEICILDGSSGP